MKIGGARITATVEILREGEKIDIRHDFNVV